MEIVWIAVGGMLGALSRYFSYVWMKNWGLDTPFVTVIINLAGCLLIGILMGLSQWASSFQRVLIHFGVVGFVASFTTFSTLGLEAWTFWNEQRYLFLAGYIFIQIIFGMVLVGVGRSLVLRF